jgi:hypothetical protein
MEVHMKVIQLIHTENIGINFRKFSQKNYKIASSVLVTLILLFLFLCFGSIEINLQNIVWFISFRKPYVEYTVNNVHVQFKEYLCKGTKITIAVWKQFKNMECVFHTELLSKLQNFVLFHGNLIHKRPVNKCKSLNNPEN